MTGAMEKPRRASAPFDLLVFDWDGTLMDSIATIVDCTIDALSRLDGVVPPPRARVREAIGMGLRESIDLYYPGHTETFFAELLEVYRDLWIGAYRDRSTLLPGARETIEALVEAGYRLGVATAKSRRGLERELEATGLGPAFVATRTVDEAPPKPHPGMILGLCEELGVEPGRALMIGDTTFDLDMARAAGAPALGVLTGSHDHERLSSSGPLAVLASVAQVPAWLDGRSLAV